MIKINAAWFNRPERGTFASIFRFMIQLGQVRINQLAPALLKEFTLFLFAVLKLPRKWLFWLPPMVAAVMAGFAGGVVDSFQYFSSGIALPVMGWRLDKYGWVTWFPAMPGFGAIGGCAMLLALRRQKSLARQANH